MILSEVNDNTLVSLSLLGNDSAYEELVKRWQRLVIGAAYAVCGSYHLAEDAAQDAFVTAWLKLNTLIDGARYGGFVCRIAKRRALDMLRRHRDMISLEACEDCVSATEPTLDDIVIEKEENAQLTLALSRLPEKIRTVVHLHYYEGLSVAEIAAKLSVPTGTVKWRLSDGRRRLGKEIEMTDQEKAFVKSVMERVEAFKLWRLKSDKSGLEAEYRELLRDIEKLPESEDKYHMEADVLQGGYWWIEGEKNDEVFARMKEAAEKGHNEDVMTTINFKEREKLSGKARIEFIRDTQIPRLTEGGWKKALAGAWFWLGRKYHDIWETELAREAFDKVMEIAPKDYVYYANAVASKRGLDMSVPDNKHLYYVGSVAEEYQYVDGKLRFWSQPGYHVGFLNSGFRDSTYVFYRACRCGNCFFDESLNVGESAVIAEGERLTFVSDSETVTVPAGTFENCQLWRAEAENNVADTYYAEGVGIVKQIYSKGDGYTQELVSYSIHGDGFLPMAEGNRWEYRPVGIPDGVRYSYTVETVFADGNKVTMALYSLIVRDYYDETDFGEMILAMRNEYAKEKDEANDYLCDVSHYTTRAEALAKTPVEKAHIKVAASVMRRIFDTDEDANPNRTASGHWNFFQYLTVSNNNGKLCAPCDYKYDFEWKNAGNLGVGYPLLYNFIYGLIENITGTLWSDEWCVGYDKEYDREYWKYNTKVHLKVTDAGRIETAAGTFDSCISVWFNARGYSGGLNYRNGRKEYFFAPGVGIVRARFVYGKTGEFTCDYDLVEYSGTGEGMMPVGDGFMRRYEAQGLKEGFEAGATYYYADDNGTMRIFADQKGIKIL